jgi:hypothetical protein
VLEVGEDVRRLNDLCSGVDLGEHDARQLWPDCGFNVGMEIGFIDAHEHLGTATSRHWQHVPDGGACVHFLGMRHAIFEVQGDRVGVVAPGILDKALHRHGNHQIRATHITLHRSSP